MVQNDIDSEDSLTVVDEAEFEGKEIADSSEKGKLDLSGEQVQLEGKKNSKEDTNKEGAPDTDDNKIVTIGKMNGENMYRVPVEVQGKTVLAIVDTAAEVTLISEELYQRLKNSPPIISETVMNNAGKGMQMNGYIVGPVSIKLGSQTFTTNVYVAPIFDDMLLGFDFLKGNGIDICMSRGQMGVKGEQLKMAMGIVNESPQVTNVSVTNRTVVPPNSVVRTEGHLNPTVQEQYIVEPMIWKDLLILRTLQNPKVSPLVCLMNVSYR